MGLITSPLMIGRTSLSFSRLSRRTRWVPIVISSLIGVILVMVILLRKSLMPISGNILEAHGIGPMMLYSINAEPPPPLPLIIPVVMTLISLAGAIRSIFVVSAFCCGLVGTNRQQRAEPRMMMAVMCLLAIVFYFMPIALISFYDRYVMPMIPLMGLFLLTSTTATVTLRARPYIEAVLCGLIVVYSVLGTHDYMNWNRARWDAIADLENREHVDAHEIDGGLEYNGSRLYDPNYVPKPGMSIWWIDKDRFQVTGGPVAGETIFRTYDYQAFLPPGEQHIYVMQKK
jgi:hypothetical protein